MQFTPQQLAGAGKYGRSVLIGNWNEDAVLQDVKAKNTQHKRAARARVADTVHVNTLPGRTPACYTPARGDGFIRFGDTVGLVHSATARRLASNLATQVTANVAGASQFQASGVGEPSLRTSFQILPADDSAKDILEFGDEVIIATHPRLQVDPHSGLCQRQAFLISSQQSIMGSSSLSGEQEVNLGKVLDPARSSAIRWRVDQLESRPFPVGADKRVAVGQPIQLVHCVTGRALALDQGSVLYNDYGAELDVFCCLHQQTRKVHLIKREHSGLRTADDRLPVQARNVWVLEAGDQQDEAKNQGDDEEEKQSFTLLSSDAVLELAVAQLAMNENGFDALRVELDALDEAGDGRLDRVTVKWALVDVGVQLSDDEFDCLLDVFDSSKTLGSNGAIVVQQLLQALSA